MICRCENHRLVIKSDSNIPETIYYYYSTSVVLSLHVCHYGYCKCFLYSKPSTFGSAFQVVPTNACVSCGGPTEFNCSTTALVNLGGGNFVEAVGGQLWRIQCPDGTVTTISSNMRHIVPAGYEMISPPSSNVFTGLRVLDTNSTWNGTTFKCIAFTPANVHEQNDSAKEVTLEVGGECITRLDKFT